MANKVERKYLAHFIDASFGNGSATPNYVRLGADLEEYNLDLNPDIEVSKNILGEALSSTTATSLSPVWILSTLSPVIRCLKLSATSPMNARPAMTARLPLSMF